MKTHKWEYLTHEAPTLAELNELGAEGWELVGVADLFADEEVPDGEEQDAVTMLVFKRERA